MKVSSVMVGLWIAVQFLTAGFTARADVHSTPISDGDVRGNGGDANEIRFKAIAEDIRLWILDGGYKGLNLPRGITEELYKNKMLDVLQPLFATVEFTSDPIRVDGIQKTCRNYFESTVDSRAHIQCQIDRFLNTSESDQYRLVHHEYAGLAGLEQNQGSDSKYLISNQITDYLEKVSLLKLSIKK